MTALNICIGRDFPSFQWSIAGIINLPLTLKASFLLLRLIREVEKMNAVLSLVCDKTTPIIIFYYFS